MSDVGEKVKHVLEYLKDEPGAHECHWPGCGRFVPPAMWGCGEHWKALPAYLRRQIWATYRPGQEVDKRPSRIYLIVANEVQAWIREHLAAQPKQSQLFEVPNE